MDVRQLFICNKQAFYGAYATWPEEKREFVAEFLHRDYMANKAGARERLFGGSAPEINPPKRQVAGNPWARAKESEDAQDNLRKDLIDVVGPWGSVTRGRRR